MSRGIIVSLNKKSNVVLTPGGQFVKLNKQPAHAVGEGTGLQGAQGVQDHGHVDAAIEIQKNILSSISAHEALCRLAMRRAELGDLAGGKRALVVGDGVEPPMPRPGMGGHVTALARLSAGNAALFQRGRTGRGSIVSTSLMRAGTFVVSSDLSVHLAGQNHLPGRRRLIDEVAVDVAQHQRLARRVGQGQRAALDAGPGAPRDLGVVAVREALAEAGVADRHGLDPSFLRIVADPQKMHLEDVRPRP